MDKSDLRKLVSELCNRSGYLLSVDADVHVHPEWVEGFIEQSKQVLLDYFENNELSI